mmetsp:Transcript_25732/g.53483  ORF Transcript_25732/g.53483 Transcript_25732/m.53483 type:complete len:342 (-) Transcript_25732:57-1082(-)
MAYGSIESNEIARKVTHYYNDHHQIIQTFRRIAIGMKPRELLMRSVWKKISQGVYVLWFASCDHPSSHPGQHGSVRATMRSGLMVQELPGTNSCKVTFRFNVMSLGGNTGPVPMYIPNIFYNPSGKSLSDFIDTLELFLKLKSGQDPANILNLPQWAGVKEAWDYHCAVHNGEQNLMSNRMERIPTEFDPLASKGTPRSKGESNSDDEVGQGLEHSMNDWFNGAGSPRSSNSNSNSGTTNSHENKKVKLSQKIILPNNGSSEGDGRNPNRPSLGEKEPKLFSDQYYTSLVKEREEKVIDEKQPWISSNIAKGQGRRSKRYRTSRSPAPYTMTPPSSIQDIP